MLDQDSLGYVRLYHVRSGWSD